MLVLDHSNIIVTIFCWSDVYYSPEKHCQ